MFLDMNFKDLTKEQLQARLADLRSQRKLGYTAPKKKISKAKDTIPGLENMDNQIAMKILAELTAMMEGKVGEA